MTDRTAFITDVRLPHIYHACQRRMIMGAENPVNSAVFCAQVGITGFYDF